MNKKTLIYGILVVLGFIFILGSCERPPFPRTLYKEGHQTVILVNDSIIAIVHEAFEQEYSYTEVVNTRTLQSSRRR